MNGKFFHQMRYLIDGYNLVYALGIVRRNGGRAAWDRGRCELLDWLADQTGKAASDVTIIFDAQNAFGGLIEERHRGLNIIRDRGRTADDLIEDLLKQENSPLELTVVSTDGRIRDAAIVRGCPTMKCEDYVDFLMNPRRASTEDKRLENEKPSQTSAEETIKWMKAFGG